MLLLSKQFNVSIIYTNLEEHKLNRKYRNDPKEEKEGEDKCGCGCDCAACG